MSSNLIGTAKTFTIASVAQLVEQRTRNAQVSGPNPDAGSSNSKDLQNFSVSPFFILKTKRQGYGKVFLG